MLSSSKFVLLYQNVLLNEFIINNLTSEAFNSATQDLIDTYKSNPSAWNQETARNADYDDAAHRCAYLHKYAPIHSCMVQDMICRAFKEGSDIFKTTLLDNMSCLSICSLGGGPGVDVIGVLSALHQEFGLQQYSVQIVDSMLGWKSVLNTVTEELKNGYGDFSKNFSPYYLQCSFVHANLLGENNNSVMKKIQSSNLITMIKFLSGAICKNTEQMVREIFNSMKQGAFLLFIDNASGGFSELVSSLGKECGLIPVFGPLNHEKYTKKEFRVRRCDSWSCFNIGITVHLLMKNNLQIKEIDFLMTTSNQSIRDILLEVDEILTPLKFSTNPRFNDDEANRNYSVVVSKYDYFDEQYEYGSYSSFERCEYEEEDYDCLNREEEDYNFELDDISCNGYFGSVIEMDLSLLS